MFLQGGPGQEETSSFPREGSLTRLRAFSPTLAPFSRGDSSKEAALPPAPALTPRGTRNGTPICPLPALFLSSKLWGEKMLKGTPGRAQKLRSHPGHPGMGLCARSPLKSPSQSPQTALH